MQLRRQIDVLLNEMRDTLPAQEKKAIKEAVIDVLENDRSVTDVLHMTPHMLHKLYEYGYKLFQGGKYKEAFGCFYFLRELDPTNYSYHFALAASHHRMKQYTEAAACYYLCTQFKPDNPAPYFHLYDCFMKLGYPYSALHALIATIEWAKRSPDYAQLLARAQLEYEPLQQQLKEKQKSTKGENV